MHLHLGVINAADGLSIEAIVTGSCGNPKVGRRRHEFARRRGRLRDVESSAHQERETRWRCRCWMDRDCTRCDEEVGLPRRPRSSVPACYVEVGLALYVAVGRVQVLRKLTVTGRARCITDERTPAPKSEARATQCTCTSDALSASLLLVRGRTSWAATSVLLGGRSKESRQVPWKLSDRA